MSDAWRDTYSAATHALRWLHDAINGDWPRDALERAAGYLEAGGLPAMAAVVDEHLSRLGGDDSDIRGMHDTLWAALDCPAALASLMAKPAPVVVTPELPPLPERTEYTWPERPRNPAMEAFWRDFDRRCGPAVEREAA